MAAKKTWTEPELAALIEREVAGSVGYLGGHITEERVKALQYYKGEPFGNEVQGRSSVVSTDVADTIEWIMPALMKIFMSGDDTVSFDPQNPEDEESAKQATEYVNWIFQRDNPGFVILYTIFKDALIQKNGQGKVWWEVEKSDEVRTVKGIDEGSFALAKNDPDVEILSEKEYPDPTTIAQALQVPGGAAPVTGAPGAAVNGAAPPEAAAPRMLYDYTYRVKTERGRCKVVAIPPEEFLINRRARSIKEARFLAHRKRITPSELIAQGYDKDKVSLLQSDEDLWQTREEIERNRNIDANYPDDVGDETTRWVWITEAYVKVDWDGDGIAEMRKIVAAGKGAIVLSNEAWAGPPPFFSLTPIIMPHRFFGMSVAELVMDLQLIKSTIMRQLLDNMYFALNQRHVISDQVNLDDYLTSRPGGAIRLKNGAMPSQGHIEPIQTPMFIGQAFPLLEYIDTVKENRTGVTRYNQGTNADSLNKTAHGVNQIMQAAQQRIEMIARIFAETGVKDLFQLILETVSIHQDEPRMIRLRNKWTPIDPRGWESKFDLVTEVGLGTGNKDQMVAHLTQIVTMQLQAVQLQQGINGPLVTLPNIYNALSKLTNAIGFKSAELFWTPPDPNAQPQPPKPDPKMIETQAKIEAEKAKTQSDIQLAQVKAQSDIQLSQAQLQAKIQGDMAALKADFMLEMQKNQMNAQVEANKKPPVSLTIDGQGKGIANAEQLMEGVSNFLTFMQQFMAQQAQRDQQRDQQVQQVVQAVTAPRTFTPERQNGLLTKVTSQVGNA